MLVEYDSDCAAFAEEFFDFGECNSTEAVFEDSGAGTGLDCFGGCDYPNCSTLGGG